MDMNKTNTLHSSTGSNAMAVPPLLVANSDGNYELTAMEGTHEFYEGIVSNTLGYNGALLGPTLRLQPNENVTILTHNAMTIPTTFHWHGLVVDDTIDGGPQAIVKPGETRVLNFTVAQPAATLWLHPHPHHQTARQVYNGLASLVYIEDNLNLPSIYGQNDFPVILQDRLFNEGQLDYDFAYNSDGTKGDMVLINGTVNLHCMFRKSLYAYASSTVQMHVTTHLHCQQVIAFYKLLRMVAFYHSQRHLLH